jgi:hypothetical protein
MTSNGFIPLGVIGSATEHAMEVVVAKGQMKSSKETRKPKKEKPKTIAANPSSKGSGGLSSN